MTTTHPPANDSGLNLDHLEALALAASEHGDNIGEDEWYSSDKNMSLFAGSPDLDLIAACGPVAVLSLIALARRAALANQPAPTVPAGDAIKSWKERLFEHQPDARKYPTGVVHELGAAYKDAEIADLRAALAHQPAQEQAEPTWGAVETVGDMVRNLLTLDQAAPVFTAFHVTIDGQRRCRVTQGITISRERVVDGKWIDSARKDAPYANIVWAKTDERAQQEPVAAPQQAAAPGALPERDLSKPAEQQGLFRKFDVRRTDDSDQPGGKHHGCRYYVLDLTHDQHAPAAMLAYAAACASTHPQLAADIVAEFGAPGTPEAPKQPAHGHRDDYYLLANGRRLGLEPISRVRDMPNWVLAMELFATGSGSAYQICRDAGVDPEGTTIQRAAQLDGSQGEGQ